MYRMLLRPFLLLLLVFGSLALPVSIEVLEAGTAITDPVSGDVIPPYNTENIWLELDILFNASESVVFQWYAAGNLRYSDVSIITTYNSTTDPTFSLPTSGTITNTPSTFSIDFQCLQEGRIGFGVFMLIQDMDSPQSVSLLQFYFNKECGFPFGTNFLSWNYPFRGSDVIVLFLLFLSFLFTIRLDCRDSGCAFGTCVNSTGLCDCQPGHYGPRCDIGKYSSVRYADLSVVGNKHS